MARISRRQLALVASAALLLLLAAGARVMLASAPAAEDPAAPRGPVGPSPSAAAVIMPGRPGEPATVKPADQVGDVGRSRYNSLDTLFVRMMIPHHTQALQMAALAPDRAGDDRIRALAGRIRASQAPEILRMRAWLDARGLALDDPRDRHDHDTMRGMQSPEAMRSLAAARGADFDRRFVEMMIDHHQGAIDLATNLLRVGTDITIEEIATSVAAEQSVEITRMRELFPPVQ